MTKPSVTKLAVAVLSAVALACGSPDKAGSTDDALASSKCGGVAGLACPSSGTCVEDPSDSCDPAAGGHDCSGICINATSAKACGGFLGLSCSTGYACVDDPRDTCDPHQGAKDCGGLCARVTSGGAQPAHCGGFAGVSCLGGATCVDDPTDACEGGDCIGICVDAADAGADSASGCGTDAATRTCTQGSQYDVTKCACEPIPPGAKGSTCGGFAGIVCQSGLTCVDVPNDACDPTQARDCKGTCQ